MNLESRQIIGIDHVAIAVRSIQATAERFYLAFGITLSGEEELPERGLRLGFLEFGNVKIELIEGTNPESVISKFIAQKGEGIHHFCIRVRDIALAMADLKAKGFDLVDEQPRPGAHGTQVAFIHPRSLGGVLVELKQYES